MPDLIDNPASIDTRRFILAQLIYLAIASLDGYIEDTGGAFDWAAPDEEVHRFVNDHMRAAGTFLYGRRMYETMQAWETEPALAAHNPITEDFAAIWQAADKIVFSTTLDAPVTRNTRIERTFDPAAIAHMKAAERDLYIGGPDLAAHALRAGLVDEYHLIIAPIVVGGGKLALPAALRLPLDLLAERRFASGMLFLRYRIRELPVIVRA